MTVNHDIYENNASSNRGWMIGWSGFGAVCGWGSGSSGICWMSDVRTTQAQVNVG